MVIEQIISLVSKALLILSCSALYVFAVTSVLPYFLLLPRYKARGTPDRGLKKYVFPDGRGVVYEPSVQYRRYIKKYLLFEYKGDKFIKCKTAGDVSAIKYDVAIHDARDRIVKYLELSELISSRGETTSVMLPKSTSYAMVILRNVNGREIENAHKIKHVPFLNRAIFTAATLVLTVVIGLLWRAYFADISTILGSTPSVSVLMTLFVSVLVGGVLAALGLWFYGTKKSCE